MSKPVSPFTLPSDVEIVSLMGDVTRRRLEEQGLFPRRIRIGKRRSAYRKTDIEAWLADPEGWVAANRGGVS